MTLESIGERRSLATNNCLLQNPHARQSFAKFGTGLHIVREIPIGLT